MTSYSMSNEHDFQCPACRARQTIRDQCRRCQADLGLLARIYRRMAYLLDQRGRVMNQGDTLSKQWIDEELELLKPPKD